MSNPQHSSPARRGLWPAVTGVTALVAIACAALGFHSLHAQAGDAAAVAVAAPRATPVSVATVAATEVNTWDEFSGRLEAVERVDVRSRVAGAVQAVHFREGALVKQGELLITIDPAPYAAEVDLSGLASGRYVLLVTVIDRVAKASASQKFGFQVD